MEFHADAPRRTLRGERVLARLRRHHPQRPAALLLHPVREPGSRAPAPLAHALRGAPLSCPAMPARTCANPTNSAGHSQPPEGGPSCTSAVSCGAGTGRGQCMSLRSLPLAALCTLVSPSIVPVAPSAAPSTTPAVEPTEHHRAQRPRRVSDERGHAQAPRVTREVLLEASRRSGAGVLGQGGEG